MSGARELDVVVFGATGFVGRLVAGYLAGHAPDSVRIGLGGLRSGSPICGRGSALRGSCRSPAEAIPMAGRNAVRYGENAEKFFRARRTLAQAGACARRTRPRRT